MYREVSGFFFWWISSENYAIRQFYAKRCRILCRAKRALFGFGVKLERVVDGCRPAKGCIKKRIYESANGQLKLSTAEEANVKNMEVALMNKLLSCHYNMDTNRVEARFADGSAVAIDCIAIEDEYGNTPAQRAELDWLLYHKPLEYAQLVLGGEIEYYLSLGCDHGRLED